MMVTGLPFFFETSPLDGALSKSQSKDSETSVSLSFGEILKSKEKQLQQELEITAAAAMPAPLTMQTALSLLPATQADTINESAKGNLQTASQAASNSLTNTTEMANAQRAADASTIVSSAQTTTFSMEVATISKPSSATSTASSADAQAALAPAPLTPPTTGSMEPIGVSPTPASSDTASEASAMKAVETVSPAKIANGKTIINEETVEVQQPVNEVPVEKEASSQSRISSATSTSGKVSATVPEVSLPNPEPTVAARTSPASEALNDTSVETFDVSTAQILNEPTGQTTDPMETNTMENQPVTSESKTDDEVVEHTTASLSDTSAGSDASRVPTSTVAQTENPEPELVSVQTETTSEPITSQTNTEMTQVNITNQSDVVQPTPDQADDKIASPAASVQIVEESSSINISAPQQSEGNINAETEDTTQQTVSGLQETDVVSPQPSSDSLSEPVTTSSTAIDQIDHQVAPSTPVAEDAQLTTNSVEVPEASTSSAEATIGSKIENSAAQTPENVSAETKPNVQEPLSAKVETDQKKSVAKAENLDGQISDDTAEPVASQVKNAPAEKTETGSTNDIGEEPINPAVVSATANKNTDDVRTVFENKSDTTANKTTSSVEFIDKKVSPVAPETNVSTQTEAKKEQVQTEQISSTSDKELTVKKQQETNPTLGSTAFTTDPTQQTVTVGNAENGNMIQARTQAAEVLQQIGHELKLKLQSGPNSIHMQLNPKELGAIDVQMVTDAKGVNVTFFAEQASTGRLLETQISQLRQSLIDSGVQLTGLNISQHGQPDPQGGFSNQNTDFTHYSQSPVTRSEAHTEEASHTVQARRQLSEVDYLI